MSGQLHAGGAVRTLGADEVFRPEPTPDDGRPNVSGDLPTLFQAAPLFRRTVAGYDRFQVDTYVRWAEDELATAGREREHLLATHLRTRAALADAEELLSHSAAGGELLQASRRVGSLLASAADEAEDIRATAEACRAAASAEAERLVAHGKTVLTDAEAEAERVLAGSRADAAEVTAGAERILEQAEATAVEARAEADALLREVREMEQRAVAAADRIRERAVAEAAAARLSARDEVVQLLTTGREERRRADARAAAHRERLDAEAADRRASLLSEIADLEHRRAVLSAELARRTKHDTTPSVRRSLDLRGPVERMVQRLEPWVTTRRPAPPAPVGGPRQLRGTTRQR